MKKESIMGSVELQKVAEKMNLKNLTPQIGLLGKEVIGQEGYITIMKRLGLTEIQKDFV